MRAVTPPRGKISGDRFGSRRNRRTWISVLFGAIIGIARQGPGHRSIRLFARNQASGHSSVPGSAKEEDDNPKADASQFMVSDWLISPLIHWKARKIPGIGDAAGRRFFAPDAGV
jgi:hypothetical protein